MDYSTWEPCEALYLDDMRPLPPNNHVFSWVLARNYQEFVAYIRQRGMPKMISFDHDLADEHVGQACYNSLRGIEEFNYFLCNEKTGMHAAHWLVNYCLDTDTPMPHFTVHSANPQGAENILGLLNNLQKEQGQTPNGYRTAW